jgi:GT2 family glycosyltransferase
VAFLDADDLWEPGKLASQMAFLEARPAIAFLFSDEAELRQDREGKPSLLADTRFHDEIVSQVPIRKPVQKLQIENFIPTSSVLVRRTCFEDAGLFDETLCVSEDRDLWSRIAAHYPVACLPEVLGVKRQHGSNISADRERTHHCRIQTWTNIRKRFPELVSTPVFHRLLAVTHLNLGYIHLHRREWRMARRAGWKSLAHGLRTFGRPARSAPRYRWTLAAALVVLATVRCWSRGTRRPTGATRPAAL